MAKKAENKKTECPLTREQFTAKAKALTLTIDGRPVIAAPKQFSTGSFGFFCNDKLTLEIDGVAVKVQANINLIVVGSKDAA